MVSNLLSKKSFIALSVLFSASFCFGEGSNTPNVIGPFGGLNNADNSAAIGPDKAQDLLNVDLSLGGKSVKKRKGFSTAYALTNTTSAVHGVYDFFDSNGNEINLAFNDTYMTSVTNGGSPVVLFSTGPNGATYQCTDSQGFAYCANTSRTNIIKTNGVTYSYVAVLTTGTMITVTPDRLVQAGDASNPNTVYFSASGDFTSWTTGVNPTSAFAFPITAPGARLRHLCYAFNRVIWFKDSSFGYILPGQTQADWVIKTISPNIGTLDNTSVYWQGILYFRSQEGHVYSYDGSNLKKETRDITGTILMSQTRASNSWSQTTQSDFSAGFSTPTAYLDTTTVSGSIILTTTAPISSFVDTSQSDFQSGTLTNLDSTTTANQLSLLLGFDQVRNSFYPGSDGSTCANLCTGPYYQARLFVPTTSYIATTVIIRAKQTGSPSGSQTLFLANDNSGSVGSTLASGNVNAALTLGDVTVNLSPAVRLVSGTTYWLQLFHNGSCDSSNKVEWYGTGVVGPTGVGCGTQSAGGTSYAYKVNGSQYSATGNIVSRTFDVGFPTTTWLWNWDSATENGSGSSLVFQTQSSTDSANFESLQTVTANTVLSSVKRYIRYKVSFITTDPSVSPILTDVTIVSSSRTRPSGTFQSQIKTTPNITAWDSFQANKQDNGGAHTFYIRASTGVFSVTSSTPSWTQISVGAIPSISTGVNFQIRDDIAITVQGQTPKLDDFTQNWLEGNATDKAYGTYFRDSIWFSVTSGTGATTNNRILRMDLINNNAWTVYDIPINGFYVKNNALYFGHALTGNVYKFGDTDNDNGSAINAYWKSKDFFNESPFTDDDITDLSLFFSAVNNSTMTVTYTLAGSSSTSYNVRTQRSNASFAVNRRNLPLGTVDNTFNIKFGNNAADQPFEVFAIQYGTKSRPWKPGE